MHSLFKSPNQAHSQLAKPAKLPDAPESNYVNIKWHLENNKDQMLL